MVIEREALPSTSCGTANYRSSYNKGYTLVELLVVCTIIGILSTIAIPTFSDVRRSVKVARAISEINGLEKEIIGYAVEKGDYPPSGPAGFTAIRRDGVLDPWGNPYVYKQYVITEMRFKGVNENTDFDLYSPGEDGLSTDLNLVATDSIDDVVRFSDGGYIGLADRL